MSALGKSITRAGWIRITVITVVGFAILPFTPGGKQFWNMRLAERHSDKLVLIVESDARFRYVRFGAYSGMGGSLYVGGTVETNEDREALRKIVSDSHPPMKAWFNVHTPEELRKARNSPDHEPGE